MEDLELLRPCLPDDLLNILAEIKAYNGEDMLSPWIRCFDVARKSLPFKGFENVHRKLFEICINNIAGIEKYRSDERFVQIWIQYIDYFQAEAEVMFARMKALQIGQNSSLFYVANAIYLEASGRYSKANEMYNIGLLRQATPVCFLKEASKGFLRRMANRLIKDANASKRNASTQAGQLDGQINSENFLLPTGSTQSSCPLADLSNNSRALKATIEMNETCNGVVDPKVNPWEDGVIEKLLSNLKPPLSEYKGFHSSKQNYNGPSLLSLKTASHNKVLELGSRRYHLKGCTGQGAFAQIFKACDERDNLVALKIQKPPCPWEYYIYTQLNKRIPQEERASFGCAWKMNTYKDCSIMVCAYGDLGTLQDVVNSYLATGQRMDELLCMYYTVEMLRMLDVLHSAGLIHGDFKPDNLLIRNDSELSEDWAPDRQGHWKNQGLCLIDWGRSIDMNLFPEGTQLVGDCKTSGFRCVEMQEKTPWTYQVDTYGLCCIVHIMLHGSYMELETVLDANKRRMFRPKTPFKRYHEQAIWSQLFSTLLNVKSCKENPSLRKLQTVFEDHLMSNGQYPKKIKELMVRQRRIMCSTR